MANRLSDWRTAHGAAELELFFCNFLHHSSYQDCDDCEGDDSVVVERVLIIFEGGYSTPYKTRRSKVVVCYVINKSAFGYVMHFDTTSSMLLHHPNFDESHSIPHHSVNKNLKRV